MRIAALPMALCAVFVFAVSTEAQDPPAGPSIEGEWEGFYSGMSIHLKIEPSAEGSGSGRRGTFDFDMYPRPDPDSNVIHISRITGLFEFQLDDDPAFGAFRFEPETWIGNPTIQPRSYAKWAAGFHLPEKDALVGLLYRSRGPVPDATGSWDFFMCFRPGSQALRDFEERMMKEPSNADMRADQERYGAVRNYVDEADRLDQSISGGERVILGYEEDIKRAERELVRLKKQVEAKQARWEFAERSIPQVEKKLDLLRTARIPGAREAVDKERAKRAALVPPEEFKVPAPEVVGKWYARAREEFPDYDPMAYGSAVIDRMGMLLCEEPGFSESFGFPRERLGSAEQLLLERALKTAFAKEPIMVSRLTPYLSTKQRAAAVRFHLAVKPLLAEEMKGLESKLAAMPRDAAAVERMNRLEERTRLLECCFWPSEWKAVGAMFERARTATGSSALAMAVDQLLEDARGPEAFDPLVTWRDDQAVLVSAAGEAELAALQERINGKLLDLMEPAMTAEITRLGSLERSSEWYERRQPQLAFAEDTAGYAAVMDALRERRKELLGSPDETLVAGLGSFPTIDSLEASRRRLLLFPGEESTPGGAAITEAIDQGILALRKQDLRHLYSKAELALMGKGLRLDLPASTPAPTTEEMVVATLRSLAKGQPNLATVRSIDSLRVSLDLFEGLGGGGAQDNPLGGLFNQIQSGCLRLSAEPDALTEGDFEMFKELGMTRADIGRSSFRVGPHEHVCKASTTSYAFINSGGMISPEIARLINQQLRSETIETSTGVQRYLLTEEGWIVPGLAEEAGKQSDLMSVDLMQAAGREFIRETLESR